MHAVYTRMVDSTDICSLMLVGLTASCFGMGATLSNLLGQMAVEKLGHVASLSGSFVISLVPICLFAIMMPETYGEYFDLTYLPVQTEFKLNTLVIQVNGKEWKVRMKK